MLDVHFRNGTAPAACPILLLSQNFNKQGTIQKTSSGELLPTRMLRGFHPHSHLGIFTYDEHRSANA